MCLALQFVIFRVQASIHSWHAGGAYWTHQHKNLSTARLSLEYHGMQMYTASEHHVVTTKVSVTIKLACLPNAMRLGCCSDLHLADAWCACQGFYAHLNVYLE